MAGNIYTWSTTAATNASADSDINFAEGQLPGTVNDSARALMAGVAGFVKDNNATISTTGSANAYAATSSNTIAALATGLRFVFKANFTNTSAATLNLTPSGGAAFGAKSIRVLSGGADVALTGGEIQNNGLYTFIYDAAANAAAGGWILLNPAITANPLPNFVINGGMEIDQANAGAAVTATGSYCVDMVQMWEVGAQVISAQQTADAPPGFKYSAKFTVTTQNATPAAGDYTMFAFPFEGKRIARLGFGAAGASSVAIGFWAKANRTGTYGGSLENAASNRSYPFSWTINASGTWEYKTVVIAGDTTGTWVTTSATAMYLWISMMVGSSRAGTAGAWVASDFQGVTGQTNGVAAVTDYMQITGVSLIAGSTPVSSGMSQYAVLPFEQELERCQRYYEKSFDYGTAPAQNAGFGGSAIFIATKAGAVAINSNTFHYKVPKRFNTVTVTTYNTSAANAQIRDGNASVDCSAVVVSNAGEKSFNINCTGNAATAIGNQLCFHWTGDARP